MPYGVATHTGNSQTPYQWLGGYGVYYDHTTELHLTTHRAYSADTRKFISPDPLGIDGGVNVYAYANLNPLFFVDPLGLCADGGGLSTYRQFVQNTVESPFNPFYWGDRIANDPVAGPLAFAAPALSPVSSIAGEISDIGPAVINTIGNIAGRVVAGGTALIETGRRVAYRISEWQPFNGLVNTTSIQGGVNNAQIITTPSASTTMFGDMIYNATPAANAIINDFMPTGPSYSGMFGEAIQGWPNAIWNNNEGQR